MKTLTSSVILIGMPGSGKSTIGKNLARLLSMPFVDLDQQIEERCGVKIPIIFEIEGEAGFRKRETTALQEALTNGNIVLATGGGAVSSDVNRELLSQAGQVVYLKASVEELHRRTSKDRNRPLLAGVDTRQRLIELMAARASIYESVANITVETGATNISSVTQKIAQQVSPCQDPS